MIYLIVKGEKTMDLMNNVYIVALKNKHFLPHAVLFIIGMIAGKKLYNKRRESAEYFGDNLPLNLIERIRHAQ